MLNLTANFLRGLGVVLPIVLTVWIVVWLLQGAEALLKPVFLLLVPEEFYLPGLGRLVFQSINSRDLIVVESVVMLLVFTVITVNFLVDLAYAAVDPRLRLRT